MISRDDRKAVYSHKRSKVYGCRLSSDEAARFDGVLKLIRMQASDACRAALFDWVENIEEQLGDRAAREDIEKRWAAHCADPRSAMQWAKKRDGLGRRVR